MRSPIATQRVFPNTVTKCGTKRRNLVALTSILAIAMSTPVGMADDSDIQIDATATANTGTTTEHTLPITLTVGVNSYRYIVVGVSLTADTTTNPMPAVASVTWSVGTTVQTFTPKQSQPTDTGGDDTARSVVQERVAPTTGAGTVTVTLNTRTVTGEVADSSPTGSTTVPSEGIGTGDGIEDSFNGTFNNSPVVRNTVTITAGSVTATDDGSGALSGTGVDSGTIDYDTGDWSITYDSPPSDGTSITAGYDYGKWQFTGTLADPGIDPLTVTFSATVGGSTKTASDNGSGYVTGEGGTITGSVVYATGLWTLDFATPPDASTNITATYDHLNEAQMVGGALSLYNVHQTLPSPGGSSTTNTTDLAYKNIDSDTRQLVFAVVATTGPAGTASERSHMTERWYNRNGTGNTDTIGSGATAPGVAAPSSTSMIWDLTNSRKWAVSGIPIQPYDDPTEARFATVRASTGQAGTLLTWRTAYEVGNLGFRVYREDEHGERVPLNRTLIAGSALFAGPATALSVGRSYAFRDTKFGASLSPYWLEAVDLDGTSTWYGPFLPEPTVEKIPARQLHKQSSQEDAIRLSPRLSDVGRNPSKTEFANQVMGSSTRRGIHRVGGSSGQWRLAKTSAARILVDHSGWYRVTRARLASAGYDPGPSVTGLQLLNEGHKIPIRITGLDDGRLDMEDAVEFFAVGIDTPSTGNNVYWLTQGVRPGERMRQLPGASETSDPIATFPATVTLQDRTVYVAAVTNNGERDNFYGPVVGSDPSSQVLTVDTMSSEDVQQAAKLEIALQGVTKADHRVAVSFNGYELEEMQFSGFENPVRTFQIDPTWLQQGENEIGLQALNGDTDVSVTDYLRLTWQRPCVASGDRLDMSGPPGSAVRVSGFSNDGVRLFDLTNRYDPIEILGSVGQDGDGGWAVEAMLPGTAGDSDRILCAVASNRIETPAVIEGNVPSSWHSADKSADMVIISHTSLLAAAERLATHRSGNGVATLVVDVVDLYDEFSWGIKDPEAIRAFLRRADSVWETPPRYVLLMGDASMDPRDYLGFGNGDFVPTRIQAASLLKTANDNWFADLNDDGLANIAVGRLPARTLQEADAMVAKITGYEQEAAEGTWAKTLTLVADAATEDFDFEEAADALEDLVPESLSTDRIDLAATDHATARRQILDTFNEGRLLVNFDGHGSQTVWASTEVFGNEDAFDLENGFKLPLVIAMNCLNGLFHDVYYDSLAEALLKNPNGGAVAVWASSALTDPTGQDLMNRDLYRSLFGGNHPAIGDAMMAAKENVTDLDIRNTWILFGDPSMRLKR